MMYRIAMLREAYLPDLQGMRRPIIIDEAYETLADAHAAVAALDAEVYVTTNGESGRPAYLIIDDVAADWVEGGRNQDASNYNWDDDRACTNTCGECNECIDMMIRQDRRYLRMSQINARGETMAEELERN